MTSALGRCRGRHQALAASIGRARSHTPSSSTCRISSGAATCFRHGMPSCGSTARWISRSSRSVRTLSCRKRFLMSASSVPRPVRIFIASLWRADAPVTTRCGCPKGVTALASALPRRSCALRRSASRGRGRARAPLLADFKPAKCAWPITSADRLNGMRGRALIAACTMCAVLQGAEPCGGPPDLVAAASAENPGAQSALSYWFAERGLNDCAVDAFRAAVRLDGEALAPRFNLGVALADRGDYQSAVEHLRVATELGPENSQTWLVLGSALYETGDDVKAERALEMAVGLGSPPDSTLALLAKVQRRLGKTEAAAATLQELLRIDPDSQVAKAMQAQRPQPKSSAAARAARAFGRGDFAEAEVAYREYLSGSPDNALVLFNLGLTLVNLGRLDEAAQQLGRAVEIRPDLGGAWLALGNAHQLRGRPDAAEQGFRKAAAADPASAEAPPQSRSHPRFARSILGSGGGLAGSRQDPAGKSGDFDGPRHDPRPSAAL